ncbi:MAG: hypothetical protein EPN21_18755 [Methylococcaceae bacterium]|nr:MAG: hypothetical protein EPN21_18755 [Methylococcaceae bacterium]
MRIAREYETPLLLGCLALLLALAVAGEWLWKSAGQRSLRAQLSGSGGTAGVSTEAANAKAFELPPLEHFDAIVERPLFIQGRRPVSAEEAVAATPDKPFDWQLHGIVKGPDGALILLKDKAGHHHKLPAGEKLDGWELAEIADDRVVMLRGEARQTLMLQKPKPKTPAKPEPKPQQAQNQDSTDEPDDESVEDEDQPDDNNVRLHRKPPDRRR